MLQRRLGKDLFQYLCLGVTATLYVLMVLVKEMFILGGGDCFLNLVGGDFFLLTLGGRYVFIFISFFTLGGGDVFFLAEEMFFYFFTLGGRDG